MHRITFPSYVVHIRPLSVIDRPSISSRAKDVMVVTIHSDGFRLSCAKSAPPCLNGYRPTTSVISQPRPKTVTCDTDVRRHQTKDPKGRGMGCSSSDNLTLIFAIDLGDLRRLRYGLPCSQFGLSPLLAEGGTDLSSPVSVTTVNYSAVREEGTKVCLHEARSPQPRG